MRNKSLYIFSLSAISFLFSFCRKDKGLSNYGDYPNEIGKIMVNQCATSGCHNGISAAAAGNLNLTTWNDLFKGSGAGSPVIPYSSKFSSLCYYINTYSELGAINGPTMPLNKQKLSKQEVQTIQSWIDAGAPNLNGDIKWADNAKRKKMYVLNQACDVVTVFDSETQLPMRFIEVGTDPINAVPESPHVIKISPDGNYWYVIFTNSNIIQKFSCSDDQLIATTSLGANYDWNTLVISDDGTRGYCVAWTSNGHIASVDLSQMKLIRNYGGFSYPHGVALNATNNTLYVTGQTGNFIYKLDTALNLISQISLNALPPSGVSSLDPHEMTLSPDGLYFYITCQKSNEIRVLSVATESVVQTFTTGTYPLEMAIYNNGASSKLFVTCEMDITNGANGSVEVFQISTGTNTLSPVSNIKVGALPHGLAVDDNKKLLYVASRNIFSNGPAPHHSAICSGRNGFVSYIDINTLQVKSRRTEVSVDPYSVAFRK